MNRIFKDLLSLHGYPLPFESVEPVAERQFGPRYGNRTVAERLFGAALATPPRREPEAHGCTAGACG